MRASSPDRPVAVTKALATAKQVAAIKASTNKKPIMSVPENRKGSCNNNNTTESNNNTDNSSDNSNNSNQDNSTTKVLKQNNSNSSSHNTTKSNNGSTNSNHMSQNNSTKKGLQNNSNNNAASTSEKEFGDHLSDLSSIKLDKDDANNSHSLTDNKTNDYSSNVLSHSTAASSQLARSRMSTFVPTLLCPAVNA